MQLHRRAEGVSLLLSKLNIVLDILVNLGQLDQAVLPSSHNLFEPTRLTLIGLVVTGIGACVHAWE